MIGAPNREFLAMNHFKDGIMRKDSKTAKLTEYEIERNKKISSIMHDATGLADAALAVIVAWNLLHDRLAAFTAIFHRGVFI